MPQVSALVLAAGSSHRLGRPKALVDLGGRTAIARILDALRDASVTHGVIVVGEHAALLRAAVDPSPLAWTENPAPEAGRTGSIRRGLAALGEADDVLLWPVDRPFATAAVVRALLAARAADAGDGAGWYVPMAAGRRAHPILLRREVLPAIVAAPPDANLRDILRSTGRAPHGVPAGDESLHFDLDTDSDVARACAWLEARA